MRNHMDSHRIADIPKVWRQSQGLVPCAAGCHRLVAGREGTVHPTCRARVRSDLAAAPAAAAAAAAAADQPTEDRPSLEEIMGSRRPTLKHIPRACRDLWSAALGAALATAHLATVSFGPSPTAEASGRCVTAWKDVLLLAK